MTLKHLAAKLLTPGWKQFSNRHKGESCYVFGDGPSIKWFDLSQFTKYPAICCGVLPFHRDFHVLRVKYLSVVEPWLFAPKIFQPKWLHRFRPLAAEYRKLFAANPDKEFFVNLSNRFSVSGDNIHYVFRGLPENRNRADELLGDFDLFAGSFHASLALAYYMGFSKLYLVGFDAWTIQPVRNIRWYELGEGSLSEDADLATAFLAILKNEIDIFTISANGQSRNVHNISYESHTGKAPQYRENHELMDDCYLRTMDGCGLYHIYPSSS